VNSSTVYCNRRRLYAAFLVGTSLAGLSAPAFAQDAPAAAIPLALTATLLIAFIALIVRQIRLKDNETRPPIYFPWFVPLFLIGVAARTYAPVAIFPSIFDAIANVGNAGILVGLFLIGAGISRSDIKKANTRRFASIFLAWLVVSAASLWAVLHLL